MFAALVIATVGAFFVTTRLKRSTPVIEQLTFRRSFSPNGDGRFDAALFAFRLRRTDEVTVAIVNRDGDEVRVLAADVLLPGGQRHRFRWDGRNEGGRVVPDGEYHLRVGLRRQGRTVTSPRKLFLDTVPPRSVVRYVSPDSISPDGAGGANSATLRFAGPSRRARLLVYRTDLRRPRLVATRAIPDGEPTVRWDGRVKGDRPAASGTYLMVVRAQDAAGNVGPRRVPPRRSAVRGHPGLAVRYVDAYSTAPVDQFGQRASFVVNSDGRRYRWSVRRFGGRRVLARGSSRSETLKVPARLKRAGVAMLTLRVGRHRYTTPFAVQGRRRQRVLVVLPDATWQARNRLEADGDGYPDLLPEDAEVTLQRPSRARPAAGIRRRPVRCAALPRSRAIALRPHDRRRARHPRVPRLDRYRGMLYAGPPRFSPSARSSGCAGTCKRAAGSPGSAEVGSTGASMSLAGACCVGGAPRSVPCSANACDTSAGRSGRGAERQIGFFAVCPARSGRSGPSRSPCACRRGRDCSPRPGRVSAARRGRLPHGRGVVARVGVDGFGRALRTSPDAARIMRRLWTLLSR